MRGFFITVGFCAAIFASQASAQVTLARQPLWLAGAGDCNHAIYNNGSQPCADSSPTGNNDSEYFSYYWGLIFQPRINGAPSYFTQDGNLVLQGNESISTSTPGTVLSVKGVRSNSISLSSAISKLTGEDVSVYTGLLSGAPHWGAWMQVMRVPDSLVFPLALNPNGGNVGIGILNPQATLDVGGSVKISGTGASMTFPDNTVQSTAWNGTTCGGDYAESVDVAGDRKAYEPGDVLVLAASETDDVEKSQESYSTRVAGIYSTKPGLTGRRQSGDATASTTEVPMAMVGIVPTKVSAENGPIHRGDLLVTSSRPGYAMKGTDRSKMLGAVVGKAMGHLDKGAGVIEVLVTLQ